MIKWGGTGGPSWVFCHTCRSPELGENYPLSLLPRGEYEYEPPEVITIAERHLAENPEHAVEVVIDGRWNLEEEYDG